MGSWGPDVVVVGDSVEQLGEPVLVAVADHEGYPLHAGDCGRARLRP